MPARSPVSSCSHAGVVGAPDSDWGRPAAVPPRQELVPFLIAAGSASGRWDCTSACASAGREWILITGQGCQERRGGAPGKRAQERRGRWRGGKGREEVRALGSRAPPSEGLSRSHMGGTQQLEGCSRLQIGSPNPGCLCTPPQHPWTWRGLRPRLGLCLVALMTFNVVQPSPRSISTVF